MRCVSAYVCLCVRDREIDRTHLFVVKGCHRRPVDVALLSLHRTQDN